MEQQLYAFANEYDSAVDRLIDDSDGQLSINHPLLFVFIGDHSLEALNAVYEWNQKNWNNSKGVLYFHVYQETTVTRENVFSLRLPAPAGDRKTIRADLHRRFHEDTQVLVELNRAARQISNRIAEYGKMYSSFQRLNMSVVTRADDPCNVLLQEIVLVLKTLLGESFKLIQMDMYGLIKEKQGEEEYPYSSSLGISFLRELDRYQDRSYQYSGMLQVTEDQIRLPILHTDSPLFDLVYLLSDKNEHGMFADGGMQANYEMICDMNLLKNRKIAEEFDHRHESYNNQHFRQHIQSADTKGPVYSTAGFSKVRRPNQAIALTVLSQFFQRCYGKLVEQSKADRRTVIELLKLSPDSLDRKVGELVGGPDNLQEMTGLLSQSVSWGELRKLTLKQAEEVLYGGHAQAFFSQHFAERADKMLKDLDIESEIREMMERNVIHNPAFGLYAAYVWTLEQADWSVFHEIRLMVRDSARHLEEARYQLQQIEQEPVEAQSFSGLAFFNKTKARNVSLHLFEKVYGKKLDILFIETKLSLLKRCESAYERVHEPLREQIGQIQDLDRLIKDVSRQSVSEANDYLGRNIPEYYSFVVGEIVQDLQSKKGEQFFWEDRYLGNVAAILAGGKEALLKKFMEVCKKEVFHYPAFRQSFEDELLQRANVTVRYEDKNTVLSKEDLYRDLYTTLEEAAAVHINVYHYMAKHRYDEKYFFADFESEFMRYAFEVDEGSRLYKLGCVPEKKSSGIEKLNIMGGFQLEDIMYVRNGTKYYESYTVNGFRFHAADTVLKDKEAGPPLNS
jgi:hypothetical protein